MLYTTSLSMRREELVASTLLAILRLSHFLQRIALRTLFFFLFLPIIFLNEKSNFKILSPFFPAIVHILFSSARTRIPRNTNLFFFHIPTPSQHDKSKPHLPSNKQQPPSEQRQSRNHLHRHTKITTRHCPSRNDNRAVGDSFSGTTVQNASD